MTARPFPRPRPKDGPREWIGDAAAIVFWPFFSLLVLLLIASGFVLFVELAR